MSGPPPTLRFSTTRQAAELHGVKFCVHGRAGAGKTTLVKTLAEFCPTILISAESGLLSLRDVDIPTIVITNFAEFEEAYKWIAYSEHARPFFAVALDSVSEVAENCLAIEKANTKDGRKAYGELHEKVMKQLKLYRDLPGRHVYFSAKQGRVKDEVTGITRYGPDMPGQQLIKDLPYLFDELFSLEIGVTPEGQQYRYLLTDTTQTHEAKDRSGALDLWEPPDLGHVIKKILAATTITGN